MDEQNGSKLDTVKLLIILLVIWLHAACRMVAVMAASSHMAAGMRRTFSFLIYSVVRLLFYTIKEISLLDKISLPVHPLAPLPFPITHELILSRSS